MTQPDDSSVPSSSLTSLLELDRVCVAYKSHEVVHSVSMQVRAGEVVALIGPSGAGKSSLLRSINFLEPPSSGRIMLEGTEISPGRRGRRSLDALRREVGMVFQSFNLFPHLSAVQNVMLAQVHTLGIPREQAKERALLQLAHVGLASHANLRPGECSGGQQQRIAIARALAMDPKVMLFDEPTSALDPELGAEVLTTMRRLAAEGMTMIVVTHEMHFAEDVADRIIFMADGRVVEDGSPTDLLQNPQHERTQKISVSGQGPVAMGHLLSLLAGGIPQTVEITASAFLLGAILGLPLAMLRRSRLRSLRIPVVAVVEILRAIPPLVWLFIIYYGVGSGSIRLSTYQAATIGLGLIAAAYLSEIYRAGLNSVHAGQWEAVSALGLPKLASYLRVILPQALVVVIPPMATYAIGLLKDSATASVIGANDITFRAVQQTQQDLNGLRNFALAGLLYILLSIPVAIASRGADKALSRRLAVS